MNRTTNMEVPFQQNKHYGCSFYTLANLFNEPQFLEHCEPVGGFIEDMNKALRVHLPEHWIETAWQVNPDSPVHNRLLDVRMLKRVDMEQLPAEALEDGFVPYFIAFKMAFVSHHVLLVHCLKDDMFYLFDSLREEVQVFTAEEFILRYWVHGIAVLENKELRDLHTWENKDKGFFLWLRFSAYPHLKPQE